MPVWNPATGQMDETEDEARARARAQFATEVTAAPAIAADRNAQNLALAGGGGVNMMTPPATPGIDPATGKPPGYVDPSAAPADGLTDEQRKRLADNERFLGLDRPAGTIAESEADPGAGPTSVQPPGLPTMTKQVERGSTTTTRTKIDPLEKKGMEAEQKVAQEEVELAKRSAPFVQQKADAERDAARNNRVNLETQHAARDLARDHFDKRVQEEEKKYNEVVQERSQMKIEEYGAKDHPMTFLLKTAAMGLGEIGAALSRTKRNPAREILDQAAKEFYEVQRRKIDEADKKVAQARQGVQDKKQDKTERLIELERENAAYNHIAAEKLKEKISEIGSDHAKLLGEQLVLDAKRREAESIQKMGALLRQQVTATQEWTKTEGSGAGGAGGGRITDSQREKTALFGSVAEDLKILMKSGGMSKEGAEVIYRHDLDQQALEKYPGLKAIGRRAPGFSDSFKTIPEKLSPKDQQIYQAERKVADVANKYITGAGQTDTEFRRRWEAFAAVPGDTPEVKRQKTMAQVNLISEFGLQGSDPGRVQQVMGGGGQQPATKQLRDPRTGRTFTARQGPDGKWYEAQ